MKSFLKIAPLISIFVLLSLLTTTSVHAATLEIECNEGSGDSQCKIVSANKELFNIQNIAPGATYNRELLVTNNDGNDDCNLKMAVKNVVTKPSNFAQRFFTAIQANNHSPFVGQLDAANSATNQNTMQDVFDADYIKFGKVTKNGGSVLYNWVITFDKDTDNSFQSSALTFDFRISFTCDHDKDEEAFEPGIVAGASTQATSYLPFGNDENTVDNSLNVAGAQTFREFVEDMGCKDPFVPWILVALFAVLVVVHRYFGTKQYNWTHVFLMLLPGIAYFMLCDRKFFIALLIAYLVYAIYNTLRKK